MTENEESINQLLSDLSKKQDFFLREIEELRQEINKLKIAQSNSQFEVKKEIKTDRPAFESKTEPSEPIYQKPPIKAKQKSSIFSDLNEKFSLNIKSDLEKFIGENGINIIRKIFGVVLLAISVKLFTSNIPILFKLPH